MANDGSFTVPDSAELVRIARKVVWYDAPEQTLGDGKTFLAHVMVFGSPADVAEVQRHVPEEEFRKSVGGCPSGSIHGGNLGSLA